MSNVNMGDYGYWKNTKSILDYDKNEIAPDRDFYVNGTQMSNVIFPANPLKDYEGDIVPIGDNEGKQFAYAWWREGKDSESRMAYGRLKAKGYDFATTDNFKVVRESFYIENGRIYHGDTVLMACTAERYDIEEAKEERERKRMLGDKLDEIDAGFNGTVDVTSGNTGIKLEPITNAPKRRK